MQIHWSLLAFSLLGVVPQTVHAEREQIIMHPRILLGDIVPKLTSSAKTVDLGAAPKAGSSRLFGVAEVNRLLSETGEQVKISDSVRVVRASARWTQQEIVELLTPALQAALPSHAKLIRFEAPRRLLVPESATFGNVEIGKLPKRQGTVQTSAIATIVTDGIVDQRISVPLSLELAAPPAPATLSRGQEVTVSIHRGAATVSAIATVLQAVAVGDVALCRVIRTKKVLRARITSTTTAEVLSQ